MSSTDRRNYESDFTAGLSSFLNEAAQLGRGENTLRAQFAADQLARFTVAAITDAKANIEACRAPSP